MSVDLILAIFNNEKEKVRELLASPEIDVNFRYTPKSKNYDKVVTPLQFACGNGHLEIVKILLERKDIDVNAQSGMDRTALHIAASCGNLEICELLLPKTNLLVRDKYKSTPYSEAFNTYISTIKIEPALANKIPPIMDLLRAPTFLAACKENDLIVVEKIIKEDKLTMEQVFEGLNATATGGKHEAVVRCLLNKKEFQGPIFYYACLNGYEDIVKELINLGVDVNGKYKGRTGLQVACLHYRSNIVISLLDKAQNLDVNIVHDESGNTALHDICNHSTHKPLVKSSSEKGDEQAVRVFLAKALINHGAKINFKNNMGRTPIHQAILFNQLDLVMLLVSKGADLSVKIICPSDLQQKNHPEIVGNLEFDLLDLADKDRKEIHAYLTSVSGGIDKMSPYETISNYYFLGKKEITIKNQENLESHEQQKRTLIV